MKKWTAILLMITVLCAFTPVLADGQEIAVMNGFERLETDVEPIIVDPGYTLIPVAALARAVGYEVAYFHEERQVTLIKDGISLLIQLDSDTVLVNGEQESLPVPATIYKDRTVVPLRFVSEMMQKKVNYKDYGGKAVVWVTDFDVLVNEPFDPERYLTQDGHIYTLKGDQETERGIKPGDTPEQVLEHYGVPVSDKTYAESRVITYAGEYIMGELEPQTIEFLIEDGKVTNVTVIRP